MQKIFSALLLLAASAPAFAVDPGNTLPTPGALSLLGIAGVAAIAVKLIRNRCK